MGEGPSGQPGRGAQLPDSLEHLGSMTRGRMVSGQSHCPSSVRCPSTQPTCPAREPLGQAELILPGWALRQQLGKQRAYLVLPYSAAAAFAMGGVCEATGSMVSVLSSTAARTSVPSCADQGAVGR